MSVPERLNQVDAKKAANVANRPEARAPKAVAEDPTNAPPFSEDREAGRFSQLRIAVGRSGIDNVVGFEVR